MLLFNYDWQLIIYYYFNCNLQLRVNIFNIQRKKIKIYKY